MVGPGRTCIGDRAINAAVVDDEYLDLIDSAYLARDIRDGLSDGLLLIVARFLDDEFHWRFTSESATSSS